MSRWGRSYREWDSWYPPKRARRAAPANGIKVKKIGATWWGKAWVDALERASSGYSNRLGRGATYARTGRVHDLSVTGGKVAAKVTGTSVYRVKFVVAPLTGAQWTAATAAMAARAVFAAKLLAGEMPQEIDEAFAAAGASIFPARAADLVTECSCPDSANPCKHVAAVHYVLGEAFDGDPFLLFELRGRTKDQVLAALRTARASAADGEAAAGSRPGTTPAAKGAPARRKTARRSPAAVAAEDAAQDTGRDALPDASRGVASDDLNDALPDVSPDAVPAEVLDESAYDRLRADVASIRFRPEPPATHAALVRGLGPLPGWSLPESFADLLAPACAAASSLAQRLAAPRDESEGADEDGSAKGE